MKLVMISQTMRNLRNTLKSQSELAMNVMTDHGESNPLRRIGIINTRQKTIHLIKVGNMP